MSSSLIDAIRQHALALTDSPTGGREAYGLLEALARVPDPRDLQGVRYPLASVLAVAVCAVMAGACTFAAIGDWVEVCASAPSMRAARKGVKEYLSPGGRAGS
ncbi:transposase family protein [Micromonospora sp. SH-82]|uniref:transposase family protein n=1 Tax=Micromonospora sp. SH-82 TaxID=3132938 RepID=UPI003EBB3A7D